MKKIGMTVFAALLGGVMALGGYKLLESKQAHSLSVDEQQKAHFASDVRIPTAPVGSVAFAQAASSVTPAVVHIKTTYSQKPQDTGSEDPSDLFEQFFGTPHGQMQQQAQPAMASGSGVIIKEDGYIVTNNHVVENADKIEVVLPDKRSFEAKIIGRDPNTDLALIKIGATGLPIVPLGNSDNVQVGEWVLAVGYPLSLESTVTAGIVSAKGRNIGIINQSEREKMQQGYGQQQDPNKQLVNNAIESFIQTDAVINMGNSGGALVNTNGELIGINSALASPSGYYAGYGFAVPTDLVRKIVEDFMKFGRVNRGLVGITFNELTTESAKELGITDVNGLYVNEVLAGGAGQKAGIHKGDILTKINGNIINGSSDLQEKVYRLHPGDQVKLTYKRAGQLHDATVTLMADKSADKAAATKEKAASRSATMIYNDLAAGFVPATSAQKARLHTNAGVVVTKVNSNGLFDYYSVPEGLVITEINGKPVNNVDDVERALGYGDHGMIRLKGYSPQGELMEMRFPSGR